MPETNTILYVKYMSIKVSKSSKEVTGRKKKRNIQKESLSNLAPNLPTMSWPTRVEEKTFWTLTSFS